MGVTTEMFFREVNRELGRPAEDDYQMLRIPLSRSTCCDVHCDYEAGAFVIEVFDGDYDYQTVIPCCTPSEMADLIRKSADMAFVEAHFDRMS